MISSIEIKTDRGLKGFKFSNQKIQLHVPVSSYKDNVSFVISSCIYKKGSISNIPRHVHNKGNINFTCWLGFYGILYVKDSYRSLGFKDRNLRSTSKHHYDLDLF